MINLVTEYLKYCLYSKKRHGVHSPFIYELSDKCLRQPIQKDIWEEFLTMQRNFRTSTQTIEVTDLGSGSKKLNKVRKVKDIASISGINHKYGKLLYKLVKYYPIQHILELGTSLGLGTFLLTSAKDTVNTITVEGCPNTSKFAMENFPLTQKHRVQFINDSFENFLMAYNQETKFDLVFIDGDHSKRSLLRQLELLEPLTHDETIFVLDDIRWTSDMLEGWESLQNNPDYHLTIDLFRIGIILKRKHQQKEHFIIRY